MLVAVVAGSMLTVAYAVRFYWGAFVAPRRRARRRRSADRARRRPSSPRQRCLAVGGIVLGVVPGVADRLATASLAGYGSRPPAVAPLAVARVRRAARSVCPHPGRRCAAVGRQPVGSAACWPGAAASRAARRCTSPRCAALGTVATRVTGFVQNGSLPVYAGVILLTAAVLPGVALLAGVDWPGWPPVGSLAGGAGR